MVGGSTTKQLISLSHGFRHRPQVAVTWEGILGKVKSEERLRALDAADPHWIPLKMWY